MKRLLILVATLVVATARPETYREKEDFQYSRSSTDEGSKSGFYGAQRGNMGGNYERAHNMDPLAQHQMSGVVRQVEGELGEAANSRRGNVFSSASTRGMYGQGNLDLSNLAGRNFQEGISLADSESASSLTASRSAGYTGHSSLYSGSGSRSSTLEAADLQSANYYNRQPQYGSSHHMQSQGHRAYEHSLSEHSASEHQSYGQSNYEANSRDSRYGGATAQVIIRPNTGTNLPTMAQAYDDSQRSHSTNANTELLNNHNSVYTMNRPRHYESSYNYRKEWERHNTVPVLPLAITTENPHFDMQNQNIREQQSQTDQQRYATNSRLTHSNYDSNTSGLQTQGLATSHISGNSHSNYHSNYDADYNQRHQSSSAVLNSNMYNGGQRHSNLEASQRLSENQENFDSKPKTYQSSYAYHKSWERQGDPYVIQPISGTKENLQVLDSDSTANHRVGASHHYGSHQHRQHQSYTSSHTGNVDCDEEGHIRVSRSYQTDVERKQKNQIRNSERQQNSNYTRRLESFNQQPQNNGFQNINQQSQTDYGQQVQDIQNLEDLGQQTQTDIGQLEDYGQQTQQNYGNLDDFGQQIQGGSYNLEDFGQQTQTGLSNLQDFGQQVQEASSNLEDLGQQTQTGFNNLEDFGQQTQGGSSNLEDLGQHTQTGLGNLEDFGQQTQGVSANLEDLGQQTQSSFGNIENLGQHTQGETANLTDFGQQIQTNSENLKDFDQKPQTGVENSENLGQQIQTNFQNLDHQNEDQINSGQQTQGGSSKFENSKTEKDLSFSQNFDQQTQNTRSIIQIDQYDFNKNETLNQQLQKELSNSNNFDQQVQTEDLNEKHAQQETQTSFSNSENLGEPFHTNLNSTNLEQDGKEGLKPHIFSDATNNTSRQDQNTFDHKKPVINYILPIDYYKSTSQPSPDRGEEQHKYDHETHEQNYYHSSNSDFQSDRHWSHSQLSQSNRHNSQSKQETNNVQRTSNIDSLWDEIYDLMASNQTGHKNEKTKASDENQNMWNNTKETLFTNSNKNANQSDHSNTIQNGHADTSQENHSNKNIDDNNKTIIMNPVRSSNYGRGDIESDDLPESNEFSEDRLKAPTVYTNDDSKTPYKTQKEIETLSLITESTKLKNNKNQVNINSHFNDSEANKYRSDTNNDEKNKVNALTEQVQEVSNNYENVYSNFNAPNRRFEGLEQKNQVRWNGSNKDDKSDQFQQVQLFGYENFDQQVQTLWNPNEDLVQEIQTVWNPNDTEQHSEQVNFNIVPQTNNQNLEHNINVLEQYVQTERISNANNEPSTHQHPSNLNDKVDSTTEFLNITSESVTENVGFWRSVGNKFSNAKNKIVSWFHRS